MIDDFVKAEQALFDRGEHVREVFKAALEDSRSHDKWSWEYGVAYKWMFDTKRSKIDSPVTLGTPYFYFATCCPEFGSEKGDHMPIDLFDHGSDEELAKYIKGRLRSHQSILKEEAREKTERAQLIKSFKAGKNVDLKKLRDAIRE